VRLRGDPQLEGRVDVVELEHGGLDLVRVRVRARLRVRARARIRVRARARARARVRVRVRGRGRGRGRIGVGRGGLDLGHELEAQVAVLQHDPRALRHARRDELARRRLLALAERDGAHELLLLLGEVEHERRRVGALREQRDDRAAAVGLHLDGLEVERPRVDVPLADGVGDVPGQVQVQGQGQGWG
jgi:hypothetical protein